MPPPQREAELPLIVVPWSIVRPAEPSSAIPPPLSPVVAVLLLEIVVLWITTGKLANERMPPPSSPAAPAVALPETVEPVIVNFADAGGVAKKLPPTKMPPPVPPPVAPLAVLLVNWLLVMLPRRRRTARRPRRRR